MLANRAIFSKSDSTMLPNAYWGVGLAWEADLLVISKRGYLTEIEIKISKADLIADARKHKFHIIDRHPYNKLIKNFYYAIPEHLESVFPVKYLERAGLILVPNNMDEPCRVKHKAPTNKLAEPLTAEMQMKALRLLGIRFWASYKAET